MIESNKCTGDGCHDWESGGPWGVIIGVSRCKRCGRVSRSEDFDIKIHVLPEAEG